MVEAFVGVSFLVESRQERVFVDEAEERVNLFRADDVSSRSRGRGSKMIEERDGSFEMLGRSGSKSSESFGI